MTSLCRYHLEESARRRKPAVKSTRKTA